MKSAYEIAMERLEAESGPSKKLNEEQKARIAEIDRKYDALIAEEKLTFDTKSPTVPPEEHEALHARMAEAVASLEEKRERQKQEIWDSSSE